jgi:hypothetical protein
MVKRKLSYVLFLFVYFLAEIIFETIDNRTTIHYNSLYVIEFLCIYHSLNFVFYRLKVYNDNKMYEKVFLLYDKLKQNQKNIKPDHITFSCLFYSAAKMGHIDRCQEMINDLNSSSIHLDNHPILQVNLINALGKCSDMILGKLLFLN